MRIYLLIDTKCVVGWRSKGNREVASGHIKKLLHKALDWECTNYCL